MALIKGPYNFISSLLSKDKALFSFSYIITLIGTIYFSIISSNYFMVLIFTFSQVYNYIIKDIFFNVVNFFQLSWRNCRNEIY